MQDGSCSLHQLPEKREEIMRSRSELSGIFYIFKPLILYALVYWALAAAMEALWSGPLGAYFSAEGAGLSGAAFAYTISVIWNYLYLILPAAAGCLAVRRTAYLELNTFSRKYPAVLKMNEKMSVHAAPNENGDIWDAADQNDSFFQNEIQEQDRKSGFEKITPKAIPEKMLPVLLAASAALSAALNSLLAQIFPAEKITSYETGMLPGLSGFLLLTVVYGLCMPLIEETLFRGILLSRLERAYGLQAAVFVSAAVFGAYHGAPVQGIYAFLMGLVFARTYAGTGRFAVPLALHGVSNLLIVILRWTGAWQIVCTPAWCLAFFAIAAAGFFSIEKTSVR